VPITANKGYGDRVLEYRAGLYGIVCMPFDDNNPYGWWYVGTQRVSRDSDTPATPYVLLSSQNTVENQSSLPLELYRPKSIGSGGNVRPAGTHYWASAADSKQAVSWDHSGVVYMRGAIVLDGLDKTLAAVLCGSWLVVWTATTVFKCPLTKMSFKGAPDINNALLESTDVHYSSSAFASSSAFDSAYWGGYISPLGTKAVFLTATQILTFSISCTAATPTSLGTLAVDLDEAAQNERPDLTDLARLTVNDDFVWVDGTVGNNKTDTWLGGYDGAVTADYSFTYQYGVAWDGETPNPVMIEVNRQFDFSFDQHTDAYYQKEISQVQDEAGSGTYVNQVDYSENHTTVITGLGAPVEVLNKAMTNAYTRTNTCDALDTYIDPERGLRAHCTMDVAIAGTDTTTKRTPTVVASDGSVAVFTEYTGDESADDITGSYIGGVGVPNDLYGGWSGMRFYPTGPGGNFDYSFGEYGGAGVDAVDGTFSGDIQKTVVAELDGDEVLRHAREKTQGVYTTIYGYDMYPNAINHRTFSEYEFPDGLVDGGRVSSRENLFAMGFMPVNATSFRGDTDAAWAQYGGKTLLQVSREEYGDHGRLIFVSDHGDGASFLDIPTGAEITGVSVI